MASEQAEKARRFRALHQRPGAFVMPNPWDAGSARLLEQLGFEALATTSGGFTCIGSPDDIAENLETISKLGFAGIGLTSAHYADEFHYYPEDILPRLERKGLRHAR